MKKFLIILCLIFTCSLASNICFGNEEVVEDSLDELKNFDSNLTSNHNETNSNYKTIIPINVPMPLCHYGPVDYNPTVIPKNTINYYIYNF